MYHTTNDLTHMAKVEHVLPELPKLGQGSQKFPLKAAGSKTTLSAKRRCDKKEPGAIVGEAAGAERDESLRSRSAISSAMDARRTSLLGHTAQ